MIVFFSIPVAGVVTQTPSPEHNAVDISCRIGRPVRAMRDGHGHFSRSYGLGWTFHQQTDEGEIRISHLHEPGENRFYERGEVVAPCGNSGAWSTGPHVHIEAPDHILRELYRL